MGMQAMWTPSLPRPWLSATALDSDYAVEAVQLHQQKNLHHGSRICHASGLDVHGSHDLSCCKPFESSGEITTDHTTDVAIHKFNDDFICALPLTSN